MGDNILESQAQNTKKRRQRQRAALKQPELIVRLEEISIEYTVEPVGGSALKPGDRIHCYVRDDGVSIDVVQDNHLVGVVPHDGGADVLRHSLGDVRLGVLIVRSICELTGTAKAVRDDEAEK
jgi:hypothetical protein